MNLIRFLVVASLAVTSGCTGRKTDGEPQLLTVTPQDAPWSLRLPSEWDTSTARLDVTPRSMTGILRTWTSPDAVDWTFDGPGPNSGSGATDLLGNSTTIVIVQRLWSPGQTSLWNPPHTARLTDRGPSKWHADAQNPGWVFRERKVCLASECVSVVEWHGPLTSQVDIDSADTIASSIRLTRSEVAI